MAAAVVVMGIMGCGVRLGGTMAVGGWTTTAWLALIACIDMLPARKSGGVWWWLGYFTSIWCTLLD